MNWLFATTVVTVICLVSSHDKYGHYVNQFAAEIPGGQIQARRVAEQLGFEYMGPVSNGPSALVAGLGIDISFMTLVWIAWDLYTTSFNILKRPRFPEFHSWGLSSKTEHTT